MWDFKLFREALSKELIGYLHNLKEYILPETPIDENPFYFNIYYDTEYEEVNGNYWKKDGYDNRYTNGACDLVIKDNSVRIDKLIAGGSYTPLHMYSDGNLIELLNGKNYARPYLG